MPIEENVPVGYKLLWLDRNQNYSLARDFNDRDLTCITRDAVLRSLAAAMELGED